MLQVRCPICDRPIAGHAPERPHHPFCSERCRLIDLGRWLGEQYRYVPEAEGPIPADPDDDDNP